MIPTFDLNALTNPKEWFRLHARATRKELATKRPDAGVHAAANFMRAINPSSGASVAVYYPVGSELDTWPLVEALFERGISVCLPVVTGKKDPLVFRHYAAEAELVKGTLGILTPTKSAEAVIPDILACPLLAFKQDGARLGQGGGYYDRTLGLLRKKKDIVAVGYAYAGQEAEQLPTEAHDEKLDWFVTEREAIKVSRTK